MLPKYVISIQFRILLQVRFRFRLTKRTKVNSSFHFLPKNRETERTEYMYEFVFQFPYQGDSSMIAFVSHRRLPSSNGILFDTASIPFKHLCLWFLSLFVCVRCTHKYQILLFGSLS